MRGSKILLFLISLLTWFILSWSFSRKSIVAGLVISFIIALVAGDLFTKNPHKLLRLRRYLWFCVYVGILSWDMLKATIEVLGYLLVPHPRVDAGTFEIPTGLKSGTGLTALANTITLIPGMATVDISDDEKKLIVHVLQFSVQRHALVDKIQKYEKLFERIYEEL